MKRLMFSEIAGVCGGKARYTADFAVCGVSTDTRSIRPGELFIALDGSNFRGSDFIPEALAKGACAVISDRDVADVPCIVTADTAAAYRRTAAYYRGKFNIPTVCVTGSCGKTTTRRMLCTILSRRFRVHTPEKNFNNGIGLPHALLQLDESHECSVLELGMNARGEIDMLTKIARPDIAVITNIGTAHIGRLGSREEIRAAKFEIVGGLRDGGVLVLNGDDPMLRGYGSDRFTVDVTGQGGSLWAENAAETADGIAFDAVSGGERCRCKLHVHGRHNAANAVLALRCAQHLGFTLAEACDALADYRSADMRTEIKKINGATLIRDCYNASPESMAAALRTLTELGKRRKIAVLGQMLELGDLSAEEHFRLGRTCRELKIDEVYFIGDDFSAFRDGAGESAVSLPSDRREEFAALIAALKPSEGDTILLKGSRGMRMESFDIEKLF